jgi:hypothetical protein
LLLAFWCGKLWKGKELLKRKRLLTGENELLKGKFWREIAEGKVLEGDFWRENNCWRRIASGELLASLRAETLRKLKREHGTVQIWGQRL